MKEKKITKAMHSCHGPPLQLVIILTSCEPVPRTPGPSGLQRQACSRGRHSCCAQEHRGAGSVGGTPPL